jgi:hypothetical protein
MNSLPDFFNSYGDPHDALVHEVRVTYAPVSPAPTIQVTLECMNHVKEGRWVFFDLTFQHVQEFRLVSAARTALQVVFELTAEAWDDKFIFSFAPTIFPPRGIAEHRTSDFHLVCSSFDAQERSID